MKLTSELTTQLAPMAPRTGPFPRWPFLAAWREELGTEVEVMVASWENGELGLMRYPNGTVELLGETDLCDYHSPLGLLTVADFAMLAEPLASAHRLVFDSLPAEVSEPIAAGLAQAGLNPSVRQHQSALTMQLPASIEDFYKGLGKKDRHELRRKRRRYEDSVGKVVLVTDEGEGQGFEEFTRLHRLAQGPKGEFMTGPRELFFRRLANQPGWRTDFLEAPEGASACLFGYTDGSDYYLYNSSFDPALGAASPGLVVLTAMIEHLIESRHGVFDFLKGEEDYKLRLGATARPLFLVEAEVGK